MHGFETVCGKIYFMLCLYNWEDKMVCFCYPPVEQKLVIVTVLTDGVTK